jgi:histone chaperone ASF1
LSQIPKQDVLGVTVILLTCSYRSSEFIRVGYYVNNEKLATMEQEGGGVDESQKLDPNFILRNILANEPRVTRFHNDWDNEPEVINPENFEAHGIDDELDEEDFGEDEEESDEGDEDEAEDEAEDEIDLSAEDGDDMVEERTFNFSEL